MKRILSALVVIPLLILYIIKLSPAYYAGLLVVVSALAQHEFYSMYSLKGVFANVGIALGTAVILSLYIDPSYTIAVMTASLLILTTLRLFIKRDPSGSLRDLSAPIIGLFYVPLLLGQQVFIRLQGPGWIILMLGGMWLADSMALYVGKSLGKKKMYPEVSPNKTIAGAYGSVAGGIIGSFIVWYLLNLPMTAIQTGIAGAVIGSVTIVGDLVESMFKRDAVIKDSGGLIPGHGGFLDKVDAALFVGPAYYWLLKGIGVFH